MFYIKDIHTFSNGSIWAIYLLLFINLRDRFWNICSHSKTHHINSICKWERMCDS